MIRLVHDNKKPMIIGSFILPKSFAGPHGTFTGKTGKVGDGR